MKNAQIIYYLDDDNDDLQFFQDAAESLGHAVHLFNNGHDLLQALRIREEKPSIIFLDVHMPILNGEEILNVIKNSEWSYIPIIMISCAYPKKLAKQFLQIGANYLMKKRSSISELKLGIEEVLQAV